MPSRASSDANSSRRERDQCIAVGRRSSRAAGRSAVPWSRADLAETPRGVRRGARQRLRLELGRLRHGFVTRPLRAASSAPKTAPLRYLSRRVPVGQPAARRQRDDRRRETEERLSERERRPSPATTTSQAPTSPTPPGRDSVRRRRRPPGVDRRDDLAQQRQQRPGALLHAVLDGLGQVGARAERPAGVGAARSTRTSSDVAAASRCAVSSVTSRRDSALRFDRRVERDRGDAAGDVEMDQRAGRAIAGAVVGRRHARALFFSSAGVSSSGASLRLRFSRRLGTGADGHLRAVRAGLVASVPEASCTDFCRAASSASVVPSLLGGRRRTALGREHADDAVALLDRDVVAPASCARSSWLRSRRRSSRSRDRRCRRAGSASRSRSSRSPSARSRSTSSSAPTRLG